MRYGFLLIYVPILYSAVFLLHALTRVPIKIGFSAVWCGSYGYVGEAYTSNLRSLIQLKKKEEEKETKKKGRKTLRVG